MMKRHPWLFLLFFALTPAVSAQPPAESNTAKTVTLVLEDQFGRRQDVAAHRGEIVLFVYGDRRANEACRELGEKLHVLFHPSAAGLPPAKARFAPVAPLQGVPEGQRSPDVIVLPVAAPGKIPNVAQNLVRTSLRKASPDVPVWLDFVGVMEKEFGMKEGQPNLAVLDHQSRLRMKINGTPDEATMTKLLQTLQNLRAEAAGLVK